MGTEGGRSLRRAGGGGGGTYSHLFPHEQLKDWSLITGRATKWACEVLPL